MDTSNIWGTFDLVGFKDILRSFSALFSKCFVTQKRLVIEQNRLKLETRSQEISVGLMDIILVLFSALVSKLPVICQRKTE